MWLSFRSEKKIGWRLVVHAMALKHMRDTRITSGIGARTGFFRCSKQNKLRTEFKGSTKILTEPFLLSPNLDIPSHVHPYCQV